jgi:hypothetical protein
MARGELYALIANSSRPTLSGAALLVLPMLAQRPPRGGQTGAPALRRRRATPL